MTGADKVAAIRVKAEVLAGRSLGDNGDALTEMAAQRACAWCNRGDTSISYAVGDSGSPALAGLAPWRRLGRVKEE